MVVVVAVFGSPGPGLRRLRRDAVQTAREVGLTSQTFKDVRC